MPVMRHVQIGSVPFDGVLVKQDVVTCIEVTFLVTPNISQEKINLIMNKMASTKKAFSQLKIRLFAPGGAPNLEPRDDIWPTDVAPIIRATENGAELVQLRWGFPPGRPKGPPVISMRSENRPLPTRPVPRASVSFLRVYREALTKRQMALHQS